jgi:hypothetical protein
MDEKMDMKKESKPANVPAIAAVITSIVAFLGGVFIADRNPAHSANPNACSISVEAENVDGSITTKIKTDGGQESCNALLSQLNSAMNNQASQEESLDDDSSASDADSASAPCAASQ